MSAAKAESKKQKAESNGMARDTVFLVKPDFRDGAESEHNCPLCAQVAGMFQVYPELREKVDVRWMTVPPPYREIAELTGETDPTCPVLVLASTAPEKVRGVKLGCFRGRQFVSGAMDVVNYVAQVHRGGRPT